MDVLDDDDGLRAGVLELVLQLARRVQRVLEHRFAAPGNDLQNLRFHCLPVDARLGQGPGGETFRLGVCCGKAGS